MKQIVSTLLVVGTLFCGLANGLAYDIRSGLLSYFPFNTTTTNDAAFTNNFRPAGVPALVTTNTQPGRGSVLQLNGASYLTNAHSVDNSINGLPIYRAGRFTVAAWVKGAPQAGRYIYAEGNSTNGTGSSPYLIIQTGNAGSESKLAVAVRNDAGSVIKPLLASSTIVFDNTWHHIAYCDDNGNVQLYIDGNLDANSGSFSYPRTGTFSLDRSAIGALIRNNVGGIFTGAIDDLSLWERALTQAEVQNIMTNGISTPLPALPTALVTEPASVTRNFMDAVTFSVRAVATRPNNSPFTYQWNSNNVPILDATNRTYRIFNLTTNNSGEQYSVTVSSATSTSVTSSNAILTVLEDQPANVVSNIISYWPLDTVVNNSGVYSTPDLYAGNSFVLTNTTESSLIGGQFGNALSFDWYTKTNSGVRSGGTPIFNKTTGYSVSLWVRRPTDESQTDKRVYAEASTANANTLFSIGTSTSLASPGARIYIRNDNNLVLLDAVSTRPVFDGNWHHLVWTDVNGKGTLYVDGVVDETDFNYTSSGNLTLNTTALGAIARLTTVSQFYGDIDDVATWTRPLNYTEVQSIMSAPVPVVATPVSFITQPQGTNVLTRANVTLSVSVSGSAPFTYLWYKGTTALTTQTNSSLIFSNIQLGDAGSYSVTVSNAAGSTNSQTAVVDVTERPAPPSVLAVDFNNRVEELGYTEAGFSSFTLDGVGNTSGSTTRLLGGVEMTVVANGVSTINSLRRGTPVNSLDFTQEKILQDFIYNTGTSGTNGFNVTVEYLEPNKMYTVTVWSFDSGSASNRVSNWYANGAPVQAGYIFNGAAVAPINNTQYQFSFYATSDSNGKILIQGHRDASSQAASPGVFLNAIKFDSTTTPLIDKQPVGGNFYVGADTTLSVTAVGVGPFTYQWFKGASPVGTGSTLTLSNMQLSDAETYSVVVNNGNGPTTSSNAVVSVTTRPAPPSTLAIDFNERGQEIGFTESGFSSFVLAGSGALAVPTTTLFGGVEVTVSGANGTTVDSRYRPSITNNAAFTQEKILNDFVYSVPSTGTNGLDVRVRFLAPNQLYNVTIWSFDDQQGTTNAQGGIVARNSDWWANGFLVKDNYSFFGTTTNEPTDDFQYQFSFSTTTDPNGTLLLEGRRDMVENGAAVFLNGLRISIPATTISNVEIVGGVVRLTVETPDSSKVHGVEEKSDLAAPSWTSVSGVSSTILSPTSIRLEFAQPSGGMRFYQVNRAQ